MKEHGLAPKKTPDTDYDRYETTYRRNRPPVTEDYWEPDDLADIAEYDDYDGAPEPRKVRTDSPAARYLDRLRNRRAKDDYPAGEDEYFDEMDEPERRRASGPGIITRRDYYPEEWEEYAPRTRRSVRHFISPKALIALGAVVCLIMLWAIFRMGSPPRAESPQVGTQPTRETSETAAARGPTVQPTGEAQGMSGAPPAAGKIRVHVAGAVKTPGVHTLPADARAIDAVNAAGGASAEADLNKVNLAITLTDGVQLYIPKEGEEPPSAPANNGGAPTSGGANPSGSAAPNQGSGAQSSPGQGQQVNLNTATIEQLQTLPRIGPALAGRIIAWRDEHGGFKSVDELDAVPGIGPAMMSSLRPLVTV